MNGVCLPAKYIITCHKNTVWTVEGDKEMCLGFIAMLSQKGNYKAGVQWSIFI